MYRKVSFILCQSLPSLPSVSRDQYVNFYDGLTQNKCLECEHDSLMHCLYINVEEKFQLINLLIHTQHVCSMSLRLGGSTSTGIHIVKLSSAPYSSAQEGDETMSNVFPRCRRTVRNEYTCAASDALVALVT